MFKMTYEDAAKFLDVTPGTIYQMVSHAKLHSHEEKGSREKFLDQEEVIRYKYRKHPDQAEAAIKNLHVQASVPPQQTPQVKSKEPLTEGQALLLQFVRIVGDIFTQRSRYAEDARIKEATEIRAVLQPIAEKVAMQSQDAGNLLLLAAESFANKHPEVQSGGIGEETLNAFASEFAFPLPAGEQSEILDILRTKAKKEGLYTVPSSHPQSKLVPA